MVILCVCSCNVPVQERNSEYVPVMFQYRNSEVDATDHQQHSTTECSNSWATARECSSTGSFLGMKNNPLLRVARIRFHLWNGGVPVVEQMRRKMFSYWKLFWHEKTGKALP